VAAALAFSVLVYLKHLFAPLALPVGAYLLSAYCAQGGRFRVMHFCKLVAVALAVTLLAFGPFIAQPNGMQQMQQIFTRLFPFDRGLVHTYWAPNVWALYCSADRAVLAVCRAGALPFPGLLGPLCAVAAGFDPAASPTTGVLGAASAFAFLPPVSAGMCLALLAAAMLPALLVVARSPSRASLIDSLVYCSLCSFMFGYHVHEKAILIPLLLSILSLALEAGPFAGKPALFDIKAYLVLTLSFSGVHGLFPLFTHPQEAPIKVFVAGAYCFLVVTLVASIKANAVEKRWVYALMTYVFECQPFGSYHCYITTPYCAALTGTGNSPLRAMPCWWRPQKQPSRCSPAATPSSRSC
jgi:alpha-1,3-glucosyltransferase